MNVNEFGQISIALNVYFRWVFLIVLILHIKNVPVGAWNEQMDKIC